MSLGSVTLVNSKTVYFPFSVGMLAVETALIHRSMFVDSALRAVRSAEASKVTARKYVQIEAFPTNSTTVEVSQYTIGYTYNISAAEFGIANASGLVHYVRGNCFTEYGWLRTNGSFVDIYYPFGRNDSSLGKTFAAPSDKLNPNFVLNLASLLKQDDVDAVINSGATNRFYTLLFGTSHVPSTSASNDAMCKTERMPGDSTGYTTKTSKLAPAVRRTLSSLNLPILTQVQRRLHYTTLKSLYDPPPGTIINVAQCHMEDDVERLALASCLAAKNLFRDTTMFGDRNGFKNSLEEPNGEPCEGAGSFVLKSGPVATLHFSTLVTVPAAALAAFLLSMATRVSRRAWNNG
ncbi:hypothetical protein B0J14DRAFT_561116 [Halenospora varia]|nr:hypothetical protein B0J14DRAFT_561116 [Halenospora varia]